MSCGAGSKLQAPGLNLETGGCIYNQHLPGDQDENGGVLAKATVEEHCVLCRLSQPCLLLTRSEGMQPVWVSVSTASAPSQRLGAAGSQGCEVLGEEPSGGPRLRGAGRRQRPWRVTCGG